MPEGIKWGEDIQRDCVELKRLEEIGIYPAGHHDQMCPVEDHSSAPPVSNEVIEAPEDGV